MPKSYVEDVGDNTGAVCTDKDAASALAQGHQKSAPAPIGYGQRSRTPDGDGPDDDARLQSFDKSKGKVS